MKVLRQLNDLPSLAPHPCLAIGVFDGVHLGHQQLIQTAIDHARSNNGQAVVLTFDPHPARVLRPDHAPRLLTTTPHKLRLLERLGVEACLLLTFDVALAQTPAATFIADLAAAVPGLQEICVGDRFRFGHHREGDVTLINRLAAVHGYRATAIPSVTVDGRRVSSTVIREAVSNGDLDLAAALLGRPFAVLGTVRGGDRIGRELGFPTANLDLHNEVMPPNGVYAVTAMVDGTEHLGVVNIGVRPTLEVRDRQRQLEVHLLDFDRDIYGQDIEVVFTGRLRDEQKFPDSDALRDQITRDIAAVRARSRPGSAARSDQD